MYDIMCKKFFKDEFMSNITIPLIIPPIVAGALLYTHNSIFKTCPFYGFLASLSYSSASYYFTASDDRAKHSKAMTIASFGVITNVACYYLAHYIPALQSSITSDAFSVIVPYMIGILCRNGIPTNSIPFITFMVGANQLGLLACTCMIEPLLGKVATMLPAGTQIKIAFDYAMHIYNNCGGRVAATGLISHNLVDDIISR